MSQKRKLVSFDWAIKRILRSKANFDIFILLEKRKDEIYHTIKN